VLGIVSVVVNDVPPLPDDAEYPEVYIINEYVKPAARDRGILPASVARKNRLYVKEGFTSTERHMVLLIPLCGP
jgi:hypothetical protein